MPQDDRAWRDLVNRIVLDVRAVLSDLAEESDRSDQSDKADKSSTTGMNSPGLLHKHGGYRKLRGFQVVTLIYACHTHLL